MKQITDEELRAIGERAEKATPGKWMYCSVDGYVMKDVDGLTENDWIGGTMVANVEEGNDAAFIAHARQDIPKLLAEIDRLSRLYCELKEIAHNIEVDRNETAAEYREYYEKSEAEIECMKKDRKIFDNTFRNIDALIDEHRLVNNRSANGLADEIVELISELERKVGDSE